MVVKKTEPAMVIKKNHVVGAKARPAAAAVRPLPRPRRPPSRRPANPEDSRHARGQAVDTAHLDPALHFIPGNVDQGLAVGETAILMTPPVYPY